MRRIGSDESFRDYRVNGWTDILTDSRVYSLFEYTKKRFYSMSVLQDSRIGRRAAENMIASSSDTIQAVCSSSLFLNR